MRSLALKLKKNTVLFGLQKSYTVLKANAPPFVGWRHVDFKYRKHDIRANYRFFGENDGDSTGQD